MASYTDIVAERVALRRIFNSPRHSWDTLSRKFDSPQARFESLGCHPILVWALKWPGWFFGFTPESKLPATLLWSAVWANYVYLGFFDSKNPAAITVHVPFGSLDANAASLVFFIPIVVVAMRSFLQTKPFYMLLAYCKQNLSAKTLQREVMLSTLIFLMFGAWFFTLTLSRFVESWRRYFVSSVVQIVFAFGCGYCFSVWVLVSRLIIGMMARWVDVVSRDFTSDLAAEVQVEMGSPHEDAVSTLLGHPEPRHSQPNEDVDVNELPETKSPAERAIHMHATIANIIDHFGSKLQALVFAKALCDFTLLLFSLGNLFEDNNQRGFTALLVVSVSFVVCIICLLPAALVTSRFQSLIRSVTNLRPFTSINKRDLDSVILYLQPYQVSGGMHFFGVLINVQIVSRLVFVIYSTLIAANILS